MSLNRKKFIALATALVAGGAMAQGYPAKPITLVVPAAAGGTTDLAGRMLAQALTPVVGQQVVVDNKAGGNGAIAASLVKRAPADGYTLLMQYSGYHVISPHLMKQQQWELADFQPIANVLSAPQIIVVRDDVPARTLAELVAYAKANPGKINRGSPGAAILSNLAPVAFEQSVGISTNHIPFNGDAQAIQAMLSGSIDIYGTSITSSLPHIKSGKFRVLGVMGAQRLPQAPDGPTFKEQGYNFEAPLRYYLSTRSGAPKETVDHLNKAINEVLKDPAFIERAHAVGMEPRGTTPQEMDKLLNEEIGRWNPMVKSLNLPKSDKS